MIRLLLEQPNTGESSHILVRSRLRAVSQRMGFGDIKREYMELVCTEILTNQQKYAHGKGLVQLWESRHPAPALDLFAIDHGPGITDVAAAYVDGFTTASTMGRGLGTIRRLADECEVYSVTRGGPDGPWHGVAVWARFYIGHETRQDRDFAAGFFLRAYQDLLHNGDAICVHCGPGALHWLHMDGLGHGEQAEQTVRSAERLFEPGVGPRELLDRISRAMRGGRGAVAIAGRLEYGERQALLCGVGDMNAMVVTGDERHNITFSPGVLGHAHGRFQLIEQPLARDALLLTASDGIRRNWGAGSFPGLYRLHPQMVAYLLGNVVGRISDDKSLFVIKTDWGSNDAEEKHRSGRQGR